MLASHLTIRFRARARGTALLVRQEPLACAMALALAVAACVFACLRARSVESCLAVAGVSAALVWLAHGTRGDERFLRAAGAPHRRVYASEYAIASLPASLLLLASPFPSTAAAPFVAVLAALAPAGTLRAAGRAGRGSAVRVPGPADAFEWKAALRGSAPGVLVVYALAGLLARWRGSRRRRTRRARDGRCWKRSAAATRRGWGACASCWAGDDGGAHAEAQRLSGVRGGS